MSSKPYDLEAVRTIVSTLAPSIWASKRGLFAGLAKSLGLPVHAGGGGIPKTQNSIQPLEALADEGSHSRQHGTAKDIKSFIADKNPSSDNQFAAAVAYYYRFEAPEAMRKETITADDLQEACRLAGRARVAKPAQTLPIALRI